MSRILFNIPKERARVSGVKSILLSFSRFSQFFCSFLFLSSKVVKSSSQLDLGGGAFISTKCAILISHPYFTSFCSFWSTHLPRTCVSRVVHRVCLFAMMFPEITVSSPPRPPRAKTKARKRTTDATTQCIRKK